MSAPEQKSRRGFAALSPERRAEIARKGGQRAHELGRAHRFTEEEARAAGKKGGPISQARRREREALYDQQPPAGAEEGST